LTYDRNMLNSIEKGQSCKKNDTYELGLEVPVEYVEDASFKKFQTAMQKILATFDTINEWADIITFLTKLIKVGELIDIDTTKQSI
jgi:hypothetical protein